MPEGGFMGKRNKFVKETSESKALRSLRLKSDYSLQQIASLVGLSKTRVSQMESGREDVSNSYIELFIKALKISYQDWEFEIEKEDKGDNKLREQCHEIVGQIKSEKLELVFQLLTQMK
jgi:transcriptional regulator with XRE-family HTH domain